MDDSAIEQMLSTGNASILNPENQAKIQKKDYPFAKRYLRDKSPDVRSTTLSFLCFINQPWCFPLLLSSMRDPVVTNRAIAAEGLLKLSLPDSKRFLFDELTFQYQNYQGDQLLPLEGLILSIGNTGTKDDIERLLALRSREKTELLMSAYQKALAKLGYPKSVTKIEHDLIGGDAVQKMDALETVNYIGTSYWVPMVTPLLNDESVAQSSMIGDVKITKKVCDLAINTLRIIDPEKRITFEDPYASKGPIPYSREQVAGAKKAYGLGKDNAH